MKPWFKRSDKSRQWWTNKPKRDAAIYLEIRPLPMLR